MKIAFFSDTHAMHGFGSIGSYRAFTGAGIAVFAGDFSKGRGYGSSHVENFIAWFSKMPVMHKIFIAGNHDMFMEGLLKAEINYLLKDAGLIYLNDSGVTINGIKFWGSPVTPEYHDWAFNRFPGEDIARHWDMIPDDVDVLITHGPPAGILDVVNNRYSSNHDRHVGCPQLRRQVFDRIKPQVHVFGHIHEAYGILEEEGITFINASVMDADYMAVNEPHFLDVEARTEPEETPE